VAHLKTVVVILLAAGGALAAALLVYAGFKVAAYLAKARESRDFLRRSTLSRSGANLPGWMEKWAIQVKTRMKRGHTKFIFGHYLFLMSVLMVLGVIVGLFLLKNTVAFAILVATAIVVPEHIVRNQVHKRRNKLLQQLGPAIRLLAAEHAGTAQINRAIVRIAPKLERPIKDVFQRAARDFLSGKDQDFVFAKMLLELDFEYGRIFVQALRVVANDGSMRELLWWLADRIATQVDDILEEESSIVAERLMSTVSIVIIFPVLFVMLRLIPETYSFLVDNMVGRTVICLCLGAPLANVLFDRLINAN